MRVAAWLTGARMVSCASDSDGTWICDLIRPVGRRAWIVWNREGAVSCPVPASWGGSSRPSQRTVGRTPTPSWTRSRRTQKPGATWKSLRCTRTTTRRGKIWPNGWGEGVLDHGGERHHGRGRTGWATDGQHRLALPERRQPPGHGLAVLHRVRAGRPVRQHGPDHQVRSGPVQVHRP